MLDQTSNRAGYVADGVRVVPKVLAPAQIVRLRAAVEDIVAQAPVVRDGVTPYFAADGTQAVAYDGGYYVEYLSRNAPRLAALLGESALPSLACELLGCDEVMFWRDEIHYKNPASSGNATPWHHGVGSFPFKGEDALTLWLPLTDVGPDSGPLLTVADTHRDTGFRYRPPTRSPAAGDDGSAYRTIPDFDAEAAAGRCRIDRWTMRAGTALGFHPYTVHGSLPNRAETPRIAYVSRWLGRDARYAPDMYSVLEPGIDPAALKDGLPDSPLFPRFGRAGLDTST
ncbi:phytanoyl-CoA dioxygenase family protein [Sphingomonas rubra]|uniref:Phytanoyl-CoA dioxygenase (PhyH) n=1 Tax=Sphingomonas rubra TaxID=634430 RepID=A0A1I5SGG0_9SPHN|nr:phytanoyl-CoA dioxygenase family protein [Sphingomonas rubra]SFP69810.1 Phytanoyl-CoA dioxygenase (PhyH) [Sphingomonas rubra]